MPWDTFSNILRDMREGSDLTLEELANALNISKSMLWDIEKGRRRVHAELLEKIADYFNVTTDYLLGRSPARHLKEVYRSPDGNEVRYTADERILQKPSAISKSDLERNAYYFLEKTHPHIVELIEKAADLPGDQQELVAGHWQWALDVVKKQEKEKRVKEQPVAVKEENKDYRPDLDKLAPLNEPDLGQALVKLSELAYTEKLTDEEFSYITKKLVEHYGPPAGGAMAAHGPKLPGQIGLNNKEGDNND